MTTKIQPTKWVYFARLSGSENHKGYSVYDGNNSWVCDVSPRDEDGVQGKQIAALIVDAGNTHTTTGLTPSELAEKLNAVREAWHELGEFLDGDYGPEVKGRSYQILSDIAKKMNAALNPAGGGK